MSAYTLVIGNNNTCWSTISIGIRSNGKAMIFDTYSTSFRDSLSGLYSEAYFAEVFQREWHRMQREQASLSIVIIHPHLDVEDIEDQLSFKLIAEVIESSTKRATDIACRFQSDEIAIGLFNLDESGTETIIKRILDSIEPQLAAILNNIDLSIGAVNILPNNDIAINDVFEKTEELANKAEHKGKNAYEIKRFSIH